MTVALKILRVYFLLLAVASVLILPFYGDMPHTYAFGFGIFALPTMPVVKLLYPLFDGLAATDYVILALIFVISIAYVALLHIAIIRLSRRDDRSGASDT